MIREIHIFRPGGIAEFGRSSAGTSTSSSGTNAVHDGYGFLRDDRFDAKNALAATKFPFSRQQYGLSLGGPVVRDQTFFYANFEQLRQRSATVITIDPANVPVINARLDAAGSGGPRIVTGNLPTSLDTANGFGRLDHGLSGAAQPFRSIYDVRATTPATGRVERREPGHGPLTATRRSRPPPSGVSSRVLNDLAPRRPAAGLGAPNDPAGPGVNISGIASWGTATFSDGAGHRHGRSWTP